MRQFLLLISNCVATVMRTYTQLQLPFSINSFKLMRCDQWVNATDVLRTSSKIDVKNHKSLFEGTFCNCIDNPRVIFIVHSFN